MYLVFVKILHFKNQVYFDDIKKNNLQSSSNKQTKSCEAKNETKIFGANKEIKR